MIGEGRVPAAFADALQTWVPAPKRARAVALWIGSGFVTLLIACAFAPWQQSVRGSGRVVAFAPSERQQLVEAPIEGRISRLWVAEGARVRKGDPLIDLMDVDPARMDRLEAESVLAGQRVQSYEARVEVLRARVDAVRATQEAAVRMAESRVQVALDRMEAAAQAVAGADAELDAAALHLTRHRVLVQQGLVSQRELEVAIATETRARTSREAARAQRDAAQNELMAARAGLEQARGQRRAELDAAEAAVNSAETDLQAAEASQLRLDSSVSRQASQRVVAPRDGTVLRIGVREGGELVRAGDVLLTIVPETTDRAVELLVDGNDAALIQPGRTVRLQLEGWPAVQFVGWPSVAVGTFGGRVAFVDATDDGQGDFRVVVVPDAADAPWPDARFLRQGVRANGWVLLEQVRLGFELWRQLNGFPPSMRKPPAVSSASDKASKSAGDKKTDGDAYGE